MLTYFTVLPDGKLCIALTAQGRLELEEIKSHNWYVEDYKRQLCYWVEWQLGNGWEMLLPEDIGALTDAPMLSDDVVRNEHGEILRVGTVWWYEPYQVRDEVQELWLHGYIVLDRVTDEDVPRMPPSTVQVAQTQTLCRDIQDTLDMLENGLSPSRLEHAKWLYQQGKLNEGEGA